MADIRIIEQDGSAIYAEVVVDRQMLSIIANVDLVDGRAVLKDFHIDGPGPRALGLARLRAIVLKVMEHFDVEVLEIQGFRRTTGAVPGHVPRPLVFRR